jgi:peptide/nickel transport system substrate-binding protein
MERHGFGPNKHLTLKVSARNVPAHRDPGVLLVETLRHIHTRLIR